MTSNKNNEVMKLKSAHFSVSEASIVKIHTVSVETILHLAYHTNNQENRAYQQ